MVSQHCHTSHGLAHVQFKEQRSNAFLVGTKKTVQAQLLKGGDLNLQHFGPSPKRLPFDHANPRTKIN